MARNPGVTSDEFCKVCGLRHSEAPRLVPRSSLEFGRDAQAELLTLPELLALRWCLHVRYSTTELYQFASVTSGVAQPPGYRVETPPYVAGHAAQQYGGPSGPTAIR